MSYLKPLKRRRLVKLVLVTQHSNKKIAGIVGVSENTVKSYRLKCEQKSIKVEMVDDANDSELANIFGVGQKVSCSSLKCPPLDWVHDLMQERHQTLMQIWHSTRLQDPENFISYSQFTHRYRAYVKKLDISMRQTYSPGEVAFVDFAGKRIQIKDPESGKLTWVEIFVLVLGYSQYIFACAVNSQKTENFCLAQQKGFEFLGCVPRAIVPDNLKAAVIKAGKEPHLNAAYEEFADHHGTTIEPARVRKPKDKSLGELGVLLVTRWITVVLRRRTFFSIEELNKEIARLLVVLNNRPFKRFPGSRYQRFHEVERAAMQPLNSTAFEYGAWSYNRTVGKDYHVDIEGHFYSIPYQFRHEKVDVKVCADKVEIYQNHEHLTTHKRSFVVNGTTTNNDHRPYNHKKYAQMHKSFFLAWASGIGEGAIKVVSEQFKNKSDHSSKACQACEKLKVLENDFGVTRFEKACECALRIHSPTYTSIKSILQCRIDEHEMVEEGGEGNLPEHSNIRGPEYYKGLRGSHV
ncbi:IS21 family transposase [Pseudoalteromonas rubra]|uniref:Integrase catalytic domain-containing protein n=1 Tax=Pseudoalteromonas rubra TaxID=43658 RepID=A0A0U3GYM2_9GAMM|nr:IS21 family transposase [Pseudoalteromonas rubra]ALU45438.1 hypothetical protein AT705_21070 [Pseudoalteromonas rubra]